MPALTLLLVGLLLIAGTCLANTYVDDEPSLTLTPNRDASRDRRLPGKARRRARRA